MSESVGSRVVLRPIATPLPLGFLALAVSTVLFSAVQLEWIAPSEGRIAALTALAATVPLQLLSSVIGFLARDPVAATGMGVLSGTWAVVGFTTWPPDASPSPFLRFAGLEGPQFNYANMKPGRPLSYKHFYTSNLSFRRRLLDGLERPFDEGFTIGPPSSFGVSVVDLRE